MGFGDEKENVDTIVGYRSSSLHLTTPLPHGAVGRRRRLMVRTCWLLLAAAAPFGREVKRGDDGAAHEEQRGILLPKCTILQTFQLH